MMTGPSRRQLAVGALALGIQALLLAGCAGAVPVQNPSQLGASTKVDLNESAVKRALLAQKWSIQEERPGAISALLSNGEKRLLAQVSFDVETIQVSFVGSENLDQEQHGSVIYVHPSVNLALSNLHDKIRDELDGSLPQQSADGG